MLTSEALGSNFPTTDHDVGYHALKVLSLDLENLIYAIFVTKQFGNYWNTKLFHISYYLVMHYSIIWAFANSYRYQKGFHFPWLASFQLTSKFTINYQCLESC